MTPASAYAILLHRYGPQGWWPVTPPGATRPRYRPGYRGRASEREAFEIALGAILTQNTAWSNVERALESLHRAGPLTAPRVLRLSPRSLERLIRPSGYFRQKAEKLRAFAAALRRRRGPDPGRGGADPGRGGRLSRWLAGDPAAVREELLAVRGIGPETADSILLYAGGRDVFVVDAYTLRIGARVGWFSAETGYAQARAGLSRSLATLGRGPRGRARVFQEFHALLVRLAKLHCRSAPLCIACPLRGGCLHACKTRS